MIANLKTLPEEVQAAIEELLSYAPYSTPPRPVYAPRLRELGMRMQTALSKHAFSLRIDVFAFAAKMSEMMNKKAILKGEIDQHRRDEALMQLEYQFTQRLRDPFVINNKDALRVVLIHIANFAMIAESNLGE